MGPYEPGPGDSPGHCCGWCCLFPEGPPRLGINPVAFCGSLTVPAPSCKVLGSWVPPASIPLTALPLYPSWTSQYRDLPYPSPAGGMMPP